MDEDGSDAPGGGHLYEGDGPSDTPSMPEAERSRICEILAKAYLAEARYRGKSEEDAQDASQNYVFSELRSNDRKAPRVEAYAGLAKDALWVIARQAVRNDIKDELKKRDADAKKGLEVRKEHYERTYQATQRRKSSPEHAYISNETRRRIMDLVATLTKRERHVWYLADVQGMTHAEIAQALGIAVSTSEGTLYKARDKLKKRTAAIANEPHVQDKWDIGGVASMGGASGSEDDLADARDVSADYDTSLGAEGMLYQRDDKEEQKRAAKEKRRIDHQRKQGGDKDR